MKQQTTIVPKNGDPALPASIINSFSDAVLSKSLEGIITSWNPAAEKIFGYTADEITGKHISVIIPPYLLKEEDTLIKKIRKGECIEHYATERIKKDGTVINVSLTISPVKDSLGNITGASKIIRDITGQKQSKKAILNAHQEKEITLNRINDAVVSLDNDWRYTFLNDAALVTHPLGREETLGKVMWDVHPEMEGTVFWDKYHEAMHTKRVVEIESYYEPMKTWFSVKIYPADNGLTIFYRDVTKSKKAEQELSQTVKEIADYKFALDEACIVAITDQKGIIRYANDNFCKISKYSKEELIGQDHQIVNSGYHPKEFRQNLWVTIAKGNIWRGEIKNRAKDGTIYWVDTTIIPFLNQLGKPYQYLAIRADITERKLVEENLKQSLKEIADYKYALEESSIVAITDQKGVISHANDNFCKISKYSREELIGQDHRIINSGYHSKEFIKDLWVTIANGKIWNGELKNRAKDGSIYWVDTTIVPFLNDEGKPYQYLAIRADITERKSVIEEINMLNTDLENRVKERTEEMESFSYSVSHDLRAPLRAVNGYAQILEEDYKNMLDTEGKRLLGEVKQNAMKMGNLIDDLLAFSRLGRKEVEKSVIDMTKITENAIREINQTTKHHAQIKLWPLDPVEADPALMQNVMMNLIENAVKYSGKKENPLVEIRSKNEKGGPVYCISDNGTGFDMQYAHKLFGVFQRLHSGEEFPGTGVGLATVKRIINKHRGSIWAEAKPGEGASFFFSLPANKQYKINTDG
jgi:PAS domain S-box-containing protein